VPFYLQEKTICISCTKGEKTGKKHRRGRAELSTGKKAGFEPKTYLYTELSTVSTEFIRCGQAEVMVTERTDVL
jgi:hypothetical protein